MYENLPIFKKALDLNVYIESAVMNFSRYNKYSIGSELRDRAREVIFNISKVYVSQEKIASIKNLIQSIEALKIVIILAKELKSLRDFKQFEILSKMAREIARQAVGWLNSQNAYSKT